MRMDKPTNVSALDIANFNRECQKRSRINTSCIAVCDGAGPAIYDSSAICNLRFAIRTAAGLAICNLQFGICDSD